MLLLLLLFDKSCKSDFVVFNVVLSVAVNVVVNVAVIVAVIVVVNVAANVAVIVVVNVAVIVVSFENLTP